MKPIAEELADGYGLAALHLQNATLTALVAKGFLTMKDAAATCEAAKRELESRTPTYLARGSWKAAAQVLTNLSQGWGTQAKGN